MATLTGPKHILKKENVDADLTLVPSYDQFRSDKEKRDWTLRTPDRRTKCQSKTILPSQSHDKYIQQVFMREEDVNRLIKRGNIYFSQGKLYYKDL